MSQELLYLFALVKPEEQPKNQPKGIFLKVWNDLLIAYKEVDKQEFGDDLDKKLEDLEWVKEQAVAHEQGIQSLLPFGTVIPFKFGRIFESWERLTGKISANKDFWTQEIDRLREKQEWSLKVMADVKLLQNHLKNTDPALKKETEQIARSSTGKAFFLKKKQDEKVKTILNRQLEEEAQLLLEKLQSLTENIRVKPISGTDDSEGRLLLNIVVLLDKSFDFFDWVEAELETLIDHQAYRFLIFGPWAAYHFLNELPESHER